MAHVVIVGGGISGLATAYQLQQISPRDQITLLESNSRPGGTIWTERHEGFQFEIGPNGFLDSKPTTQQLCQQLGLGPRLVEAAEVSKNRFLFLHGKLQKLPGGFLSFLLSPLLSWRAKLALLLERFGKPRPDLDDESVFDFAARRTHPEIAHVFADALVTGIHAADPRLLSIRAAFPRVADMERQHGSVTGGMIANARQKRAEAKSQGVPYRRGARLYSFPEGLRLLVETLASQLRLPLIQGVAVQRIEREERGWRVVGEGRDRWQADAVVLACPAYSQARIVAEVAPDLANLMQQIPYAAAVVVGLGFRRSDIPMSLDGFGYIAPQHTRQDLLGVQWCSSVYPQRAPEGMVLLRAIAGGWNRPEIVGWPETQLVSAIRAELRLAMGIAAPPAFQRVVRWERAIPQYHVGHLKRLVELEAGLARYPGLFLTGNAYHGVAMNDCTEQASLVAQRVQAYLAQPVT